MVKNPVSHVLEKADQGLTPLFSKLKDQAKLNAIFKQHLEPLLASHCYVIHSQKNCLIVMVDNNQWITQLRFYIPELLLKLKQHPELEHIQAICCKAYPIYEPVLAKKQRRKWKSLPAEMKELLLQLR